MYQIPTEVLFDTKHDAICNHRNFHIVPVLLDPNTSEYILLDMLSPIHFDLNVAPQDYTAEYFLANWRDVVLDTRFSDEVTTWLKEMTPRLHYDLNTTRLNVRYETLYLIYELPSPLGTGEVQDFPSLIPEELYDHLIDNFNKFPHSRLTEKGFFAGIFEFFLNDRGWDGDNCPLHTVSREFNMVNISNEPLLFMFDDGETVTYKNSEGYSSKPVDAYHHMVIYNTTANKMFVLGTTYLSELLASKLKEVGNFTDGDFINIARNNLPMVDYGNNGYIVEPDSDDFVFQIKTIQTQEVHIVTMITAEQCQGQYPECWESLTTQCFPTSMECSEIVLDMGTFLSEHLPRDYDWIANRIGAEHFIHLDKILSNNVEMMKLILKGKEKHEE